MLAFNPHASGNGGEPEVPCTLYGCHAHLCNGSCGPCCLKAAFEYFPHGAARQCRHLSGIRCALCPPPRPEGIRFTTSLEFDVAGVRGRGCTVLHSCAASRWSVRRGGILFYCNCCSRLRLGLNALLSFRSRQIQLITGPITGLITGPIVRQER